MVIARSSGAEPPRGPIQLDGPLPPDDGKRYTELNIEITGSNRVLVFKIPTILFSSTSDKGIFFELSKETNHQRATERIPRLLKDFQDEQRKEYPAQSIFNIDRRPYNQPRCNPDLFFYLLENFSNSALSLSDEEREELKDHIYTRCNNALEELSITEVESDRISSDEYCESLLYSLTRILNIEAGLEVGEGKNTNIHKSLLEGCLQLICNNLEMPRRTGFVSINTKEFFEQKLINIAIEIPELRKPISRLLDNWRSAEWIHEAPTGAQDRIIERNSKGIDYSGAVKAEDMPKILAEQQEIFRKFMRMHTLLTPYDEATKRAWDSPLNYLSELSEKKRLACLVSAPVLCMNSDENSTRLSNSCNFVLDWFSKMERRGITQLGLISDHYNVPILTWLGNNTELDTNEKLTRAINNFIKSDSSNIRTFLYLPKKEETDEVTSALAFYEELKKRIESAPEKTTITLFCSGTNISNNRACTTDETNKVTFED